MYRYRHEILIDIVVFDPSEESIAEIEKAEIELINELQPIWNRQNK
jgi:hypothetical protein